ncbi:hypothetical protein [Staphylococcus haemolyticus]|uniref:Uncharacterized protein n=1 Tax=Cronobacter phage vB_CsaM_GAP31 TaxID=1141135 RepID=K4F9A7_9CAUD|nr:hypothetical protein [Staphylococcus haemolyticus]YP_006987040.1 hypothetical protein GAP31_204 [Cronobacter phage vB_CsaM_GAP31]AFC21385.1 hypothetical protein GAP31_204 [Cronobacter phage vB_CsaM_GAP31]MCC3722173.1 hypothetical protein [Staphylococcus haemolyticus]
MVVYSYTPMIRSSDGKYPVYLTDFRADNPNVSIGTWVYSENIAEFGYFPVIPVTPPTGDVVLEGPPEFNDQTQQWEQTWTSRDFSPEEIAANLEAAKQNRKAEAQNVLSRDVELGIPYPVGNVEYKVRVKSFDLATLLTIKSVLDSDGDQSSEVYPFRFLDGYKSDFTHAEMKDLVLQVSRAQYNLMKSYWSYLDQVEQASTIQNIPAVPESFL